MTAMPARASSRWMVLSQPLMDARTVRLLTAPIVPTLLAMAWPNILVMLAQASTGLIETWWVSRLGHRRAGRHGAGVSRAS